MNLDSDFGKVPMSFTLHQVHKIKLTAVKLRNDPAWQFFEMKAGHDAMIIDPEDLARVLLLAAV